MILGLNKYTHSAAACLFDAKGTLLGALAKERLTRKKHDGGDVADLVRCLLEGAGARRSQVKLVVQNNHLFRIADYEQALPLTQALHAAPPASLDAHNLLPGAATWELSHHLAHAWSVLPVAPFAEGLISVMDGMGSPRDIVEARGRPQLATDASLEREPGFVEVPAAPDPNRRWREAETVYSFRGGKLRLVFKRWTAERSPVFLHNYGFEDMESLGAVYSRIASHVFGDWNECGKVMGLAAYGRAARCPPFLRGPLERLRVDWDVLGSLPHPNQWTNPRRRRLYESMAARVQADLERVVLDFLRRLGRRTGSTNLCFTGGVALNSLLNGRIAREAGFTNLFIPPYPGDEGVAMGCAHFGVHRVRKLRAPRRPHSPYLGPAIPEREMLEAVAELAPWIEVDQPADLLARTVDALASHEFVAWFQGRSEFGPRALGNRSILAHPGRRRTWRDLNARVKKREAFRPFAPTVLAERAEELFEVAAASPYMSLTVRAARRTRNRLAAVVHVDGSSRIQTLERDANPLYYDLLRAFEARTGLPVLLNTSFNIEGEPIVETPRDALRAFLDSELHLLVLGPFLVRKRTFPSGRRLQSLRPMHEPDALVETRTLADGRTTQVLVLHRGKVHEDDELGRTLLEHADGRRSTARLIESVRRATGASTKDIRQRLQQLWRRRLVRLVDTPDTGPDGP